MTLQIQSKFLDNIIYFNTFELIRVCKAVIRSAKKSTLMRCAYLASPSKTGVSNEGVLVLFRTRKYVTNTKFRISVCCKEIKPQREIY